MGIRDESQFTPETYPGLGPDQLNDGALTKQGKMLAQQATRKLEQAQKQDAKLSKQFNRHFDARTGTGDFAGMFDDDQGEDPN